MNELIEKINQDLENYTNYYEMVNYFRKENNKLFNILMNVCSYSLNDKMDSLSDTLLKNVITQEISSNDIELLSDLVGGFSNVFLKARVYHFLFIKRVKRNRNDAINAMKLYIQCSKEISLKEYGFHDSIIYLFILLYIGNLIHVDDESFILARNMLLEILDENKNDDVYKSIYVLSFVNRLQILSKENLVDLSCDISEKFISVLEYGQAILALEIAKDNVHLNDVEKISNINRNIADCYMNIARIESGIKKAHFLLKAINTLAKIKNTREERLSLYEEMRDAQRESMLELQYFETQPMDMSLILEYVRNILKESKDFFDMLFRLSCCIIDIIKIETIKNKEVNESEGFIDIFYGQRIYIDHEGIPINIRDIPPTIDFGDISDNEKNTLWSKIVERIRIHHSVSCVSIQEGLRILNSTYSVEYQFILDLCRNTPFVPHGHEEFFAKGIIAGLNGDFLTASHLLVPQIENSLRHLLMLRAEEPTTLHANNEQERDGLKSLLDNPEIIRIFGIDGVIHLRTILLDKRYPSLRHAIAHGFIDSSHFYGTGSIYLWWLILRIIMIPYKDCWEKKYS